MRIDPNYHRDLQRREEEIHRGRLASGRPICLGERFRGILGRDGSVLRGPFLAAAWREGILLAAGEDRRSFAFVKEDAAALEGFMYTGRLPQLIVFREEPAGLVRGRGDREACVTALRRAAAFKWISRISDEEAELLLDWCRESAPGSPAGETEGKGRETETERTARVRRDRRKT